MKRISILILALGLIILYTSAAWADIPAGFGAKAVGMGGAFTAVADDGSAPYWNPAGITQIKFVTITPAVGLQGKYDLSDKLIDTNGDLPEFNENDFQLASMDYLGITSRYFAINGMIDLSATAIADRNTMTAGAESYGYGALTIAGKFGEQLAVGVNLKTVQAVFVETSVNSDNVSGSKKWAEGEGMAFDIGVLYRLSEKTRVGFVGRNVIGKVDWDNGTIENYTLLNPTGIEEPWDKSEVKANIPKTYTVGIAYNPYESLTLAADAEIIDTWNKDNDQTRIHVGLEQTALWKSVALRLGGYTNKDKGMTFTGGIGFKLLVLVVDLAYVSAEDAAGYYVTAGLKF